MTQKDEMPREVWACYMAGTSEFVTFMKESVDGSTTPYILKSEYDKQGEELDSIIDFLELEIKVIRTQAKLIENRNPDGSLNEIANAMKVSALKLETRVLEHMQEKP